MSDMESGLIIRVLCLMGGMFEPRSMASLARYTKHERFCSIDISFVVVGFEIRGVALHTPREEELSRDMEAAAQAFKEHLLETQRAGRHPVVFEETGTHQVLRSLLQDLSLEQDMVIIHILAPEATCQKRVMARGTDDNYSKSAEFVAEKRAEFFTNVIPALHIDAEFCNDGEVNVLQPPFSRYLQQRES